METETPYIFPDVDDLPNYVREQLVVWGLEALRKEFWDSLEIGRIERNETTMSYLKMITGLRDKIDDHLAKSNTFVLNSEVIEKIVEVIG